jgi:hypothetical protein
MFSACSALASHKNEKSPLRECLCVGERGCKGCVLLLFTSRVKDTHPSAPLSQHACFRTRGDVSYIWPSLCSADELIAPSIR